MQIFLFLLILIICFKIWFERKRNKINRLELMGWLLLWLGALALVVKPDIASQLASLVGIGRGADLVVYLALVLIFYLLFRLVVRIETLERHITEIVRHSALNEWKNRR